MQARARHSVFLLIDPSTSLSVTLPQILSPLFLKQTARRYQTRAIEPWLMVRLRPCAYGLGSTGRRGMAWGHTKCVISEFLLRSWPGAEPVDALHKEAQLLAHTAQHLWSIRDRLDTPSPSVPRCVMRAAFIQQFCAKRRRLMTHVS